MIFISCLYFRRSTLFSGVYVWHSHHLPQRIMPVTTTTLQQYEIPGETRSAVSRHYSLTEVAEMEVDFRAAIPSKSPYAVGLSVELASVGPYIETLALAVRDQIFCLSLRQQLSPMQSRALQKLLSDIPYLTGFEMSHTIVLLAHTLGSDVAGYDLSTVAITAKPTDFTTPGDFLHCMSPSVCARRINERWDGGIRRHSSDSTGLPDPNYALRAWFTAMYVTLLSLPLSLSNLRFQRCEHGFSRVASSGSITEHKIR
jgi:hypothetical protein